MQSNLYEVVTHRLGLFLKNDGKCHYMSRLTTDCTESCSKILRTLILGGKLTIGLEIT